MALADTLNESIEIQGKIKRIVHKNESVGFFIAYVIPTGKVDQQHVSMYGTYSVKGYGYISEDMEYAFKGKWLPKNEYGYTFEFTDYSKTVPKDEEAIKSYLCSKLFKGIGPALADKIVAKFGLDTLRVMETTPERLMEVDGIGEKKYKKIMDGYSKNAALEELILFLSVYNISIKKIMKIYEKYGDNAIKEISNNPYILYKEIDGFGFVTCDIIASKMHFPYDSYQRLKSGIDYILQTASQKEGHLYLPEIELNKRFHELFKKSNIKEYRYKEVLLLMIKNEELIKENYEEKNIYYLPYFYKLEKFVAYKTNQLISIGEKIPSLEVLVDEVQRENKIKYAEKQVEAMLALNCGSSFYIITGSPGTGKSTIIKGILKILKKNNNMTRISLAAPTGRAAKRMEEATGYPASTIHRLLECNPYEGRFTRNAENPLDCDVLIVDESSMIDIVLFSNLINAVRKGSRLIMVGDADQLPPVGPGNVFKDLINSGIVKVIRLNQVFRQGEGSVIKVNTQAINKGNNKMEIKPGEFETKLYFKRGEEEKLQDTIVEEFNKALVEEFKEEYKIHPLYQVQILSPMRKGLLGVNALNKRIQANCNSYSEGKKEIVLKGKEEDITYRIGDKVMQISNDYEKEVFNGDLGLIKDIKQIGDSVIIIVEFENGKEVEFDKSELRENLVLAYVTTVHKAQGSEFNKVVVITSSSHNIMLQRNLLYTAVSRAKEKVTILGDFKAFAISVKNVKSYIRYSCLQERLKKLL